MKDPKRRFLTKINKTDSCWIWLAAKIPKGYGYFYNGHKNVGAHRYSYEIFKGKIPDGYHVCHSCDVPSCVNPDHLFIGTNNDNRQDSKNKGRTKKGKDHWNYGSGIFTQLSLKRDDTI